VHDEPGSHWFGETAPQKSPGTVQGPQLTVPPQPSPMTPHSAPACVQLRGSQPMHWFGTPPTIEQT
jgi:hypothetical protein